MSKKVRLRVMYHGIEWTVEGFYQKEQKMVAYKKNGDPGEPGFPADLIDPEIWIDCKQGPFASESDDMQDILTPNAVQKIIDLALEQINDKDYDPNWEEPW